MKEKKLELRHKKRRLNACLDFLKRQRRAHTFVDISVAMNVPAATVRGAFSYASPFLSGKFIEQFCAAYPNTFSSEWIERGEGEMLQPHAEEIGIAMPHRWQRVSFIMKNEGLTYGKMSQQMGMSNNSTLYRVVTKQARPQDSTLDRILETYPAYNREWLYTGVGEPLEQSKDYLTLEMKLKSNVDYYDAADFKAFSLVQDPAVAGHLTGYGDPDPEEMHKTMVVPVEYDYQGEYRLFKVKGASMDDGTPLSLSDGDIVLARLIPRQYWQYKLHKNAWRYFIFITRDEGIIIKSIREHDPAAGVVHLHSLNPDYPDITLRMEDVYAIYNVIELTRRSLKY